MGHTLIIESIEAGGRTFMSDSKLFIKNLKCVAYFEPCSDYMNLNRAERRGDKVPDESKLYGFDWMRSDYKNNYGYYWDARKFIKDKEGNNTTEADCEKIPNMNFSKLEAQYEIIKNQKEEDEKYYVPWLSITKEASARVDLKFKWNHKPKEILLEYDESILEITHENIQDKKVSRIDKSYKNLTIRSLTSFSGELAISIKADGLLVGKLILVPNNKIRQVNVGWCFVEFENNGNDVKALGNEVNQQKITKMLTYLGLKQAQLDVSVAAKQHVLNLPQIFSLNQFLVNTGTCPTLLQAENDILAGNVSIDGNITSRKGDIDKVVTGDMEIRYNKAVVNNEVVFPINKTKYTTPKDWTYSGKDGDKDSIIDKVLFKNDLFAHYRNIIKENNGYDIVLVFVNETATITQKDAINKKVTEISRLSGEAESFNGKFVVIYKGFKEMVLVHEVLHCMSLSHSFASIREHSFKAIKTDNIMDYSIENQTDPRKSLWKWQWEKLWDWHKNK